MKLWCTKCNKDIEADLVTGEVIYPHRPDLYSKYFYKCPKCGNYVGYHPNTTKTLGCIPTTELKKARSRVHTTLDRLWKSGKYKRGHIYKVLSEHFGYTYHNGNTKTVAECEEALKVLEEHFYERKEG
jgi:hypothetical protein